MHQTKADRNFKPLRHSHQRSLAQWSQTVKISLKKHRAAVSFAERLRNWLWAPELLFAESPLAVLRNGARSCSSGVRGLWIEFRRPGAGVLSGRRGAEGKGAKVLVRCLRRTYKHTHTSFLFYPCWRRCCVARTDLSIFVSEQCPRRARTIFNKLHGGALECKRTWEVGTHSARSIRTWTPLELESHFQSAAFLRSVAPINAEMARREIFLQQQIVLISFSSASANTTELYWIVHFKSAYTVPIGWAPCYKYKMGD